MFPITDPQREADIRMRRRRAVGLLAGIGLVVALLASGDDPVQGASRMVDRPDEPALSATGASLVVELPCAGSVTLTPRADLSGRIMVSGGDRASPASGGMRLSSDGSRIMLSGGCRNPGSDLVVQAPATMQLTLMQSGDTDFHLGAFTGPVHLSQHGSGDMEIDGAGTVDAAMTGSGDLSIGWLHGDLHVTQRGSGDLSVKHIDAAAVGVDASGTGDISFEGGSIERFDAVMRGSGDLSVEAEVGNASVQAGSNSDVTLPNVRGRLVRVGDDDASHS